MNICIIGKDDYNVYNGTSSGLASEYTAFSPANHDIYLLSKGLTIFEGCVVEVVLHHTFSCWEEVDVVDVLDPNVYNVIGLDLSSSSNEIVEFLKDNEEVYDVFIFYDMKMLSIFKDHNIKTNAKLIYRSMYDDCNPANGFYGLNVFDKLSCVDAVAVNTKFSKDWYQNYFCDKKSPTDKKPPVDFDKVFVWSYSYDVADRAIFNQDENLPKEINICISNLADRDQKSVIVSSIIKVLENQPKDLVFDVGLHLSSVNTILNNIVLTSKRWENLKLCAESFYSIKARNEIFSKSDIFISMWKAGTSAGDIFTCEAANNGCLIIAAATPDLYETFEEFKFFNQSDFENKLSLALSVVTSNHNKKMLEKVLKSEAVEQRKMFINNSIQSQIEYVYKCIRDVVYSFNKE